MGDNLHINHPKLRMVLKICGGGLCWRHLQPTFCVLSSPLEGTKSYNVGISSHDLSDIERNSLRRDCRTSGNRNVHKKYRGGSHLQGPGADVGHPELGDHRPRHAGHLQTAKMGTQRLRGPGNGRHPAASGVSIIEGENDKMISENTLVYMQLPTDGIGSLSPFI